MAWKCPPLHLFNWNNAWKWKKMDNEIKLQLAITKLVLQDPEPHMSLIEEALEFFLLDGIGDAATLQEIYDDAKNRIKVY
jgi:hypothetical protein